jgi:hypothetical protein
MLPRLDEIEDDLLARRARAEHEAWLGEAETRGDQAPGPHRAGRPGRRVSRLTSAKAPLVLVS